MRSGPTPRSRLGRVSEVLLYLPFHEWQSYKFTFPLIKSYTFTLEWLLQGNADLGMLASILVNWSSFEIIECAIVDLSWRWDWKKKHERIVFQKEFFNNLRNTLTQPSQIWLSISWGPTTTPKKHKYSKIKKK